MKMKVWYPGMADFLRERIGRNWVLHRRTARIVDRYGEDVICLTLRQYKALEVHHARLHKIERFRNHSGQPPSSSPEA
jgi:hypothetical protein